MLILTIATKELIDALRDKRTLLVVLLSSLLGMPLIMLMLSEMIDQVETQTEKQVVRVVGMAYAPQLENYFLRHGVEIKNAGADYEKQLQNKEISEPVLVIPADFQEKMDQGQRPEIVIVSDSSNKNTKTAAYPLKALLGGYMQEQVGLNLAMRGISSDVLRVISVAEHDLNQATSYGAELKAMLPFTLIMTMLSAGMYAAIDTAAGERERGSLEPLMMKPVSSWSFAVGKWLAVAMVSMSVVVFSVLSLFPSRLLIRNETVRLMFQFNVTELLQVLLVLLPLAACAAALQIAIAINSKSHKEAQARTSLLLLMAPLVLLIGMVKQGADPIWFNWVPILAQNQLIVKLFNSEAVSFTEIIVPVLICLIISIVVLHYISYKLRRVLA